MISPIQSAAFFLIKTFFNAYITILLIRFLFQLIKADFYNPISQFIVKATNPALVPLRKIIPGFMGIDFASVVLLIFIQSMEIISLMFVSGESISLSSSLILGLITRGLGEIISLTVQVFSFSIFIVIIISWVNPGSYNPFLSLLQQLTEPLLRPARRIIPSISGLDLSPMLVLIALQLINILFAIPLMQTGSYML